MLLTIVSCESDPYRVTRDCEFLCACTSAKHIDGIVDHASAMEYYSRVTSLSG